MKYSNSYSFKCDITHNFNNYFRETKYESLGPKFKELKAQWEDIEGKISVKEWSLRELEKAQNISGMEDSFLGDSFS